MAGPVSDPYLSPWLEVWASVNPRPLLRPRKEIPWIRLSPPHVPRVLRLPVQVTSLFSFPVPASVHCTDI